jgi:hypothetical protein
MCIVQRISKRICPYNGIVKRIDWQKRCPGRFESWELEDMERVDWLGIGWWRCMLLKLELEDSWSWLCTPPSKSWEYEELDCEDVRLGGSSPLDDWSSESFSVSESIAGAGFRENFKSSDTAWCLPSGGPFSYRNFHKSSWLPSFIACAMRWLDDPMPEETFCFFAFFFFLI